MTAALSHSSVHSEACCRQRSVLLILYYWSTVSGCQNLSHFDMFSTFKAFNYRKLEITVLNARPISEVGFRELKISEDQPRVPVATLQVNIIYPCLSITCRNAVNLSLKVWVETARGSIEARCISFYFVKEYIAKVYYKLHSHRIRNDFVSEVFDSLSSFLEHRGHIWKTICREAKSGSKTSQSAISYTN